MDILEKIDNVLKESNRYPKAGDRVKVSGIYGKPDRFGVVTSAKGKSLDSDIDTVQVQFDGEKEISMVKPFLVQIIEGDE